MLNRDFLRQKDRRIMNRRHFLRAAALTTLSGAALSRQAWAKDCTLTTPDILGPFFQPEAPFRKTIALSGEPGQPLSISGTVSDCAGPLRGALIEVWQANSEGCYSINEDCGVLPGQPDKFRLRGRLRTDEEGRYGFDTIKPKFYRVGPQSTRPSHIHYKVTLPGNRPEEGTELITQVYFQGDPFLEADRWSSSPAAQPRIIPLRADVASGALQGIFDIVLPNRPAEPRSRQVSTGGGFPAQSYDLLIRKFSRSMIFSWPEEFSSPESLRIYTAQGELIWKQDLSEACAEWDTQNVPPGIYLARLLFQDQAGEHAAHIQV